MTRDAAGGEPPESVREPASPKPARERDDLPAARTRAAANRGAPKARHAAQRSLEAGDRLADFRILSPMERADDGRPDRTYIAEDEVAGGLVALQVLPAHDPTDRGLRARFMGGARELAALARQHSAIAFPRRFGEEDGWLYLASPYPDAADLGDHLARSGPLRPAAALRVLRPVAEALDAARRRGIVHGDVRPANILVSAAGRVYVANLPAWERRLSRDSRADVAGFGRVLFACLTGIQLRADEPPPRVSSRRPDLPAAVDGVLAKAVGAGPGSDAGYGSCVELVDAFAAAVAPSAGRGRRPPVETPGAASALVGAAMAIAAALGLVGITFAAGFWAGTPAPVDQPTPAHPTTPRPAGSDAPHMPSFAPRPTATLPGLSAPPESEGPTLAPTVAPATPPSSLPAITVGDAQLTGGPEPAAIEFAIRLSAPATDGVLLSYETLDGTALAGSDYTATGGTIEIAAGQSSAIVRVPVLAALPGEPDESFSLRVVAATHALIADGTGSGVIVAPLPNRPPTCDGRAVSVPAGGSTQLNARCTDPDGDVLTFEIVSPPAQGSARVDGSKIRFAAQNGARGSDSFTYRASDGELASAPATIDVTFTAAPQPNRAPTCQPRELSVVTGESESVRPRCSDRDGDALTYRIAAQGRKGTASVTDSGRLRYSANSGARGTDRFTYTAFDGSAESTAVTVTVTIGASPPPPSPSPTPAP